MKNHYLWEKLGSIIQNGLNNDAIYEIMLNSDGKLWFKHKSWGNVYAGEVSKNQAASFVHALSQYEDKFLNHETPYLDGNLPFHGERINITIPPISDQISFNIRKKAKTIFTLENYLDAKIITEHQAFVLEQAIIDRKNILVSGSPASGKTTLTNALLDVLSKVAPEGHRVLILEQVPELQCAVKNIKNLLVSGNVSMNKLLWIAMRNSPDRIVIGEVRDGSALDMLKAWNTGCPGGIATLHANSPKAAIQRVLDLACEVVAIPPYALTAEALNVIVQIEEKPSHPAGRLVTGIVEVQGLDPQTNQFILKNLDE